MLSVKGAVEHLLRCDGGYCELIRMPMHMVQWVTLSVQYWQRESMFEGAYQVIIITTVHTLETNDGSEWVAHCRWFYTLFDRKVRTFRTLHSSQVRRTYVYWQVKSQNWLVCCEYNPPKSMVNSMKC